MSMIRRHLICGLAVMTAAASIVSAIPAEAGDNNQDYRRRVVGIAGIIKNVSTNLNDNISRGQFARMLVNASTYADYVPTASSVSVYADVPQTHDYANYIRIASEQGWMVGYLGGLFRPEQPITLREAVRGVLAILGYEDDDFTGDVANSRMELYYALELNEELDRLPEEILTKSDCVNLFYNMLKCENTSGTVYGTILGCTVNSDGEINPMGLADTNLVGPKLVTRGSNLSNYVPFNVHEASIFIDGEASSYDKIKSEISSDYVVIYYNTSAKTIWAYVAAESGSDIQSGRCAIRGEIECIYYESSDVMTPSSITLESDTSIEYKLESSDMQFAFSIFGSLRVGDDVTLICEKTSDSDGDESYTIIDYVDE